MEDYKSPISPGFPRDSEASEGPLLGDFVDSPSERQFPFRRGLKTNPWKRRRILVGSCAVFSIASLIGLVLYTWSGTSLRARPTDNGALSDIVEPPPIPILETLNRTRALLGPPAQKIRDNLRPDTKYITSWISAGWTNDVMTWVRTGNLIYLAILTQRVPILGQFIPSHIGGDAGTIPFSEVFDIDLLSEKIGMPVLEWRDVKDPFSTEVEDIGCWSVWQAVQAREPNPRLNNALQEEGLDISWTAGPSWLQKFPGYEHDPHAHFWDVAKLTFKNYRDENLKTPQASQAHQAVLEPDEHLACFDYLYYVCATASFEYEQEISPAWRFVVTHFRWTSRLQGIANEYLKRMMNVPESDSVPPYIAIHARRQDFGVYCNDRPKEECFTSFDVYTRRVAEIQQEVKERLGVEPHHVVMLSDEKDPAWWDTVRGMGWYSPDHDAEQTVDKYGKWYTLLIDAVIQSSGVGFLGTDHSTMSVLAGRRVEDWQNGVSHMVKWGTPDADAH
ncbi:hypothetical protein OF83DRAFT_366370 [Amylostereum chailletii]|nr:hypothetical protein OF83DRAFT_366370 [Amylostereum chailletii]